MEKEHFEILLEEMRGHFQLLAEGYADLLERMARNRDELLHEIRAVGARVDRVETRLDKVETKVDKLTVKVDRIEKSQRAMKKQMTAFVESQAEHESRIEQLEESIAGQLDEQP